MKIVNLIFSPYFIFITYNYLISINLFYFSLYLNFLKRNIFFIFKLYSFFNCFNLFYNIIFVSLILFFY